MSLDFDSYALGSVDRERKLEKGIQGYALLCGRGIVSMGRIQKRVILKAKKGNVVSRSSLFLSSLLYFKVLLI